MDYRNPSKGVSPIIATLLLVAITVAAAVIVYVFVSGYVGTLTAGGGQQTAQQVELTAYSFTPLSGTITSPECDSDTSAVAPCLTVSVKDTGGSSITIGDIYFDGLALAPNSVVTATPITIAPDGDATFLLCATGGTSTGDLYTGIPTSVTGGSTNTLKIVTSSGALFSYTVIAGASQ